MSEKLGVLFATFEAVPFVKTGGLGDVAGSLPAALNREGCDARVIMPLLSCIPWEFRERMEHVCDFYFNLSWRNLYCGIEKLEYNGVVYYFVDNKYYFDRGGAYGYFDDGERMAYLSKAVVECIQYLPDFTVDVLHCNDWHVALAPVFLREFFQQSELYRRIKTVFTVHNLKFQGQMSAFMLGDVLGLDDKPAAVSQLRVDNDSISFLRGALNYSDAITTVSETYSGEIQNSFYGEHEEEIFRRRADVLYGILNGIDTDIYDPATDKDIAANYSLKSLKGKAECKAALQKELGLEVNPDKPLIIMVGRLTQQKGMDLVKCVLSEILYSGMQVAVLGTGDREYENLLNYFAANNPKDMSCSIRFDDKLSHRMYAGADILLMPSLFEPCGLSQMIAMRYGTLPLVRETGGLRDSVKRYNKFTHEGTGFGFCNYNAHEMLYKLKECNELYVNSKKEWKHLMKNAMMEDFSWKNAAQKYISVYRHLFGE